MGPSGVLVIGSITADVTAYARRLPVPGETVIGDDVSLVLGGKGANQAVAAAHFGAPTWMVGCVGDDAFADIALTGLIEHGVQTERVRRTAGKTGIAHIRVDSRGQNDIVITPLANGELTEVDVDDAVSALDGRVTAVLLQLEVDPAITAYAAAAAQRAGLTVILDPAPARSLPANVWGDVDIVTPNETEAQAITGVEVSDAASAERAARWFLDRGSARAVITLGSAGALSVERDRIDSVGPIVVSAVDTTAAGDAFTGTLGAALAAGLEIPDALIRANAAGALAVTRSGASASLPDRSAIEATVQRLAR